MRHTNRLDDAGRAFERNLQLSGRKAMAQALLGFAYARADRRPDAERLLKELQATERKGYASGTAFEVAARGAGRY